MSDGFLIFSIALPKWHHYGNTSPYKWLKDSEILKFAKLEILNWFGNPSKHAVCQGASKKDSTLAFVSEFLFRVRNHSNEILFLDICMIQKYLNYSFFCFKISSRHVRTITEGLRPELFFGLCLAVSGPRRWIRPSQAVWHKKVWWGKYKTLMIKLQKCRWSRLSVATLKAIYVAGWRGCDQYLPCKRNETAARRLLTRDSPVFLVSQIQIDILGAATRNYMWSEIHTLGIHEVFMSDYVTICLVAAVSLSRIIFCTSSLQQPR